MQRARSQADGGTDGKQKDAWLVAAHIDARSFYLASERSSELYTIADDPNLDTRLTYIRRQSGLDSRAALFVLSPVGSTELQDFVKRWSISFLVEA